MSHCALQILLNFIRQIQRVILALAQFHKRQYELRLRRKISILQTQTRSDKKWKKLKLKTRLLEKINFKKFQNHRIH